MLQKEYRVESLSVIMYNILVGFEKMKHIGICKFCGKQTTIIKSHIIPKCFYGIKKYGGLTQFDVKNITMDLTHNQNGYKEYLLCAGCDNKLGELDKYAYDILYNVIPKQKFELTDELFYQYSLITPLFNFYKLRRFFLSLIWRKSISNMDPKHLGFYEKIALKILKNEAPDNLSLFLPIIYRKETNMLTDNTTGVFYLPYDKEYWFKFFNYEVLIIIDTYHTNYWQQIEILKQMFTSKEIKIPLIMGQSKLDLILSNKMLLFKDKFSLLPHRKIPKV